MEKVQSRLPNVQAREDMNSKMIQMLVVLKTDRVKAPSF